MKDALKALGEYEEEPSDDEAQVTTSKVEASNDAPMIQEIKSKNKEMEESKGGASSYSNTGMEDID